MTLVSMSKPMLHIPSWKGCAPLSLLEGDGVSLMLQFIAFFISILHNQFNCLRSKDTNKFSNCKINANYLANINDFLLQSIYLS